MYLPATELQQFNGQWTCPYCIMDIRDEERKRDEPKSKRPKLDVLPYPERCERCGRDLEGIVYLLNDRKLCKSCLDEEKDKWELVSGAPMGSGQKISVTPIRDRKNTSLFVEVVSEILYALKVKKRPVKQIVSYDTKMPIAQAKPLTETPILQSEDKKPETEGLMAIREEKVAHRITAKGEIIAVRPIREKPKKKSKKSKPEIVPHPPSDS